MHILVLSDNFMPLSNVERVAYLMTREYVNLGHQVSVITIDSKLKNGKVNKLNYNGITIYQIGSSYSRYLRAYLGLYNPWVLKPIKLILKDNEFNFVHLHNIHAHISYAVISLLKSLGINRIMTAHDFMSIDYGKFTQGINPEVLSEKARINPKINPLKTFLNYKRSYNPFRNIIIKYYLNKLDKIVTVSKAQEYILNANGVKNTYTINNGISEYSESIDFDKVRDFRDKYDIRSDEKVILWAGRLSKAKGLDQVVLILNRLIEHNYRFRLLVAGGDVINDEKLDKYVISTGWLNEEEMRIMYEVSSLVIVPSICVDAFPTVVLESMQSGTPVVATCFGGASEAVVNGKTGFIINPFNTDVFFDSVLKILDDAQLSYEMSVESKKIFKNSFTIKDCINQYLDLLS
jgi:glycosyltransferase involved in cell wall biosynthesis